MKKYKVQNLSDTELEKLLFRPKMDFVGLFETVQPILDDVKADGDKALAKYTRQFDSVNLEKQLFEVRDIDTIEIPEAVREAFTVAYQNIRAFHKAQLPQSLTVETMPGVVCSRVPRAIERVGLYIPGGTAILPSSVLMLAIPAQLAGCKEIILATPPRMDGTIPLEVEFAAALCGVRRILLAGGAQAIAAMAYGTETVPKVDKILGPGNQYVTAAKMLLQNSEAMISIDMPAGPSEVLVYADETAEAHYVAADLLSQAEHGVDSQVVLVTLPGFDLQTLESQLEIQCSELPREQIARKALGNSFVLECQNQNEAIDFINKYAPEHLIMCVSDAENQVDHIINAGSVFVGNWTPESVGDYASGTNHTLPTYGYARMYSGVSVDSYIRFMTIQKLTEEGIAALGPNVEIMAKTEGLDAHARAVTVRLQDLKIN
jgi:histidinol dehydrogenase